jgi:hypothetical protein
MKKIKVSGIAGNTEEGMWAEEEEEEEEEERKPLRRNGRDGEI